MTKDVLTTAARARRYRREGVVASLTMMICGVVMVLIAPALAAALN